MKTLTFLTLAASVLAMNLDAQDETPFSLKGRTELSPAISFTSTVGDGDGNSWILTLPVGATYFVTDYLGLGGEIMFTEAKGDKNTGILGSLSVESCLPSKGGALFYLRSGIGLSNSDIVYDRTVVDFDYGATFKVLSQSAGIKIPILKRVYGKAEVRYQHFWASVTYDDWLEVTVSEKVRTDYINANFGICILL